MGGLPFPTGPPVGGMGADPPPSRSAWTVQAMARNGASIGTQDMERHAMMTWEDRYDAVVIAAWERWTKNGLGLDTDDVEQTTKSVRDAATNVWQDGMTDEVWVEATLARLEG